MGCAGEFTDSLCLMLPSSIAHLMISSRHLNHCTLKLCLLRPHHRKHSSRTKPNQLGESYTRAPRPRKRLQPRPHHHPKDRTHQGSHLVRSLFHLILLLLGHHLGHRGDVSSFFPVDRQLYTFTNPIVANPQYRLPTPPVAPHPRMVSPPARDGLFGK